MSRGCQLSRNAYNLKFASSVPKNGERDKIDYQRDLCTMCVRNGRQYKPSNAYVLRKGKLKRLLASILGSGRDYQGEKQGREHNHFAIFLN